VYPHKTSTSGLSLQELVQAVGGEYEGLSWWMQIKFFYVCSAYLQYGVTAVAFMSSIIWVLTSLVTVNFEHPVFYTGRCCWMCGVSRSSHMTWEDSSFHLCHLL